MSDIEDFLEQDDSIPGQKYVCLSFISPEKVLKDKNLYYLHNFLKDSFKDVKLTPDELVDKYKDYMFQNEEHLEEKFYEKNNFRTTVRGVKIRGVYDTIVEAKARSSRLQKRDPNFNVYVGQVGFWLPWDPESHKIEDEEYANQQLNELMSEYKKNREYKDELFEQDKQEKLDNMKREREEADKKRKIEEQKSKENEEKIKESLEDEDPWMKRKNLENDLEDLPDLEDVDESNDNTKNNETEQSTEVLEESNDTLNKETNESIEEIN